MIIDTSAVLTVIGTALVAVVGWLIIRTINALDRSIDSLKVTIDRLDSSVNAINTQLKVGEAKLEKVDELDERLTKIERRCIDRHGLEGMEEVHAIKHPKK